MQVELTRNPLVLTRENGTIEHSVFIRDGDKPIEHLVHLAVLPSGHATVVDYDTHPGYHCEHSPEAIADKVERFLDLGGDAMLGHPNSPPSRDAEVSRIKARHGLTS